MDGAARVFDDEKDAMAAVAAGRSRRRRGRDPVRGAGRRAGDAEMLAVTAAIGRGLGKTGCHHRRPVLRRDARAVHRARRAGGDPRRADRAGPRTGTGSGSTWPKGARPVGGRAELERRRAGWKLPPPRYETGALAKYAKLVGSRRPARTVAVARQRPARGMGFHGPAGVLSGCVGQPERSPERPRPARAPSHGLLHAALHAGLRSHVSRTVL